MSSTRTAGRGRANARTKSRDGLKASTVVFGLLAIWEAASRFGVLDPDSAPAPTTVLAAGADLVVQQDLLRHLQVTLLYIVGAFAISMVLGVVIGVVLASSELVSRVSEGFLTFFLSIPKSVFLPLFIFMTGIGATQKIWFGVFTAVAVIVISTMAGIQSVDATLVKMARSIGISRYQMFSKVYLRSMIPILLEAARLGLILAITGVLLAEMYVSREGLGRLISTYSKTFDVAPLMAVIAIAALIGIFANEGLRRVERRNSRWKEGFAA
jgi:ABC-type nitrate/sulfonate/bicarbonate transport system permease component